VGLQTEILIALLGIAAVLLIIPAVARWVIHT